MAPRIFPILIDVEGKHISIEFLKGKFVLNGEEHMDMGVRLLFERLKGEIDRQLIQTERERLRAAVQDLFNKHRSSDDSVRLRDVLDIIN